MHVPNHILVTGFGPFPGVDHNPTELLIDLIRENESHNATRHLVLPVSFGHVLSDLIPAVDAHSPKQLLHLGVASESNTIRVETQAYNHIQARVPDIDGRQPRNARVTTQHPKAALLPGSPRAQSIVTNLSEHGLPAVSSTDAGRYVCNALFYMSLLKFGGCADVSFVHIPPLGTPYPSPANRQVWDITSLSRALEIILKSL